LFTEETQGAFESKLRDYTSKGFRTIAIAMKEECGALTTYTGPEHEAHKLL